MDEYMKSNNSVKIVFTSFPYMYLKGIWNPPIFNNTFINIAFSVLFVQLFAEIKLLKYIYFFICQEDWATLIKTNSSAP